METVGSDEPEARGARGTDGVAAAPAASTARAKAEVFMVNVVDARYYGEREWFGGNKQKRERERESQYKAGAGLDKRV